MLFKDSATLRAHAQLDEVNFASIKATIQSAEDKHIIPVLGRALYNALNTAYAAQAQEQAIEAKLQALLVECRKAIAPYTCYYYAPKADVTVGDTGIRRTETATNKTAFQYQGAAYREANLQEAEAGIENLIAFLEDKKADYPLWTSSEEYKFYRSLFIKTASDFNFYFPSHTPYRNYWAMRAKMVDVEEIGIRRFLGDALFTTLKTKDAADTFTAEEKVLVQKLKKAIALTTVAEAVPFLTVRLNDNGITVSTVGARSDNDAVNSRSAADGKTLDFLISASVRSAKAYLQNAADFLKTNKTIFTTWPGNIATADLPNRINTNNSVFSL